ncbi:hypothetical protein CQ13_38445 [Bradyrhizobium retamae]|uniref:Uncharacterized protein n=1 Tax=Bradyrhizobium retamae TaxID=1300035 RepID=A0A0R3NHB7_9BRAD|nr:hypothetical protein CQ13_38445 [Bradyrhizobium retamae]
MGGHEVVEDFDYGLKHEPPKPDEWLGYDVPPNPFTIFMDSNRQTSDLLADHGKEDGRHLINRLMFSHQVTALEAYLGDTLLNAVAGDAEAMQRLIDGDDELAKEKFTLAEIRKEPNLVARKVREHLRGILYHNLAKVDVLYNIALGVRILNLTPNKAELFTAVIAVLKAVDKDETEGQHGGGDDWIKLIFRRMIERDWSADQGGDIFVAR